MNKQPYAVTDGAVELCKKLGKSGMSGFLNAILRKYIKNPNIQFPNEEINRLSVTYSYPVFAVKE
jgi:16S rRNA C967 or C1407 C5-methylase (RsmB/RsmF family)